MTSTRKSADGLTAVTNWVARMIVQSFSLMVKVVSL